MTPPPPKCDKCSRVVNAGPHAGKRWTACTCPDGPTRQKIPEAWKRGSRT